MRNEKRNRAEGRRKPRQIEFDRLYTFIAQGSIYFLNSTIRTGFVAITVERINDGKAFMARNDGLSPPKTPCEFPAKNKQEKGSAVGKDHQPENDPKRPFAGLVAKGFPGGQCPGPSPQQGGQVQMFLRNPPSPVFRGGFIPGENQECVDAGQGIKPQNGGMKTLNIHKAGQKRQKGNRQEPRIPKFSAVSGIFFEFPVQ